MTLAPLRIALNAQTLPTGSVGGVASVLTALVHALGELDGPEEYTVIGPKHGYEWLEPHLGSSQKLVAGQHDPLPSGLPTRIFRAIAKRGRGLLRWSISRQYPYWPAVPISDGFYEQLGCSVIHFPTQQFTLCASPSIYTPHDLQHRHFPSFFTTKLIAHRETVVRGGCKLAMTITAGSEWVKRDLVAQYGISPERIQVIPWAAPTYVSEVPTPDELEYVRTLYKLPAIFCLYPASTWAHKNHIRLLESIDRVRQRFGVEIDLVCTGGQLEPTWTEIQEAIHRSNLQKRVRFLGFIPQPHLRALYRLSRFVVIPTLFEAASGPLFEAWKDDAPVGCSNVTSLPEQAGDAALLFDPLSVEEIATALHRLWSEAGLRSRLIQSGQRRVGDFSWKRTATAYRAVYRQAAGIPLDEEERALLAWDWMRSPVHDKTPEQEL